MFFLPGLKAALGGFGSAIKRGVVSGAKTIGEALGLVARTGRPVSPVAVAREVAEARRVGGLPTTLGGVAPWDAVPYDLHQQVSVTSPKVGPVQYTVHAYGRGAAGTKRAGQFMAGDFNVSFPRPVSRQEIEDVARDRFGPEGPYPIMMEVKTIQITEAFVMEGTSPW